MLPSFTRIAALGAAILIALAACGGAAPSGVATLQTDAPGAAPGGSPTPSMDPETAQLEFARCMREHGVDVQDPGSANGPFVVGGGGADIETMQEATEACNHFLESAFGKPTELDPEMQDKLLEFAACMRDHGIDYPDPSTEQGGVAIQIGPDGIDPSSEEFQEAQEACQSILGGDGPQFGSGTEEGGGSGPGLHVSPIEPVEPANP